MILVQKGLIYHPVKKSAVHIEMHTQLGLATLVVATGIFLGFFGFFWDFLGFFGIFWFFFGIFLA